MSAILPPSERLWWKHPLDRLEAVWIVIAFIWCMVMFFMMPYWHVFGKQNLAHAAVKTNAEASPRYTGMSLFIAEKGKGFTVSRKLKKLGYL